MAGVTGTEHTLRLERTFAAPRERVFRALTEAEQLKRWKAPGEAVVALAEVDLKVGGAYRIHMQGPDGTVYRLRGEYREIERPSRLVFTWQWEHEEGAGETLVTMELDEAGGQTRLRLTHEGFASEKEKSSHRQGWEATLEKLGRLF